MFHNSNFSHSCPFFVCLSLRKMHIYRCRLYRNLSGIRLSEKTCSFLRDRTKFIGIRGWKLLRQFCLSSSHLGEMLPEFFEGFNCSLAVPQHFLCLNLEGLKLKLKFDICRENYCALRISWEFSTTSRSLLLPPRLEIDGGMSRYVAQIIYKAEMCRLRLLMEAEFCPLLTALLSSKRKYVGCVF